jgi:hypothetical protein
MRPSLPEWLNPAAIWGCTPPPGSAPVEGSMVPGELVPAQGFEPWTIGLRVPPDLRMQPSKDSSHIQFPALRHLAASVTTSAWLYELAISWSREIPRRWGWHRHRGHLSSRCCGCSSRPILWPCLQRPSNRHSLRGRRLWTGPWRWHLCACLVARKEATSHDGTCPRTPGPRWAIDSLA